MNFPFSGFARQAAVNLTMPLSPCVCYAQEVAYYDFFAYPLRGWPVGNSQDMENGEIEALRYANRIRRYQFRVSKREGVTGARYAVLSELDHNGGEGTATNIAERLGTSRQAVQRILSSMADQKLLFLRQGKNDSRQRIASIAPAGRQLLVRIREERASIGFSVSASTAPAYQVDDVVTGLGEVSQPRSFEMVRNYLLHEIRAGRLQSGDKLPPERELGVRLGVGRPVVREALRSLEMAGVVKVLRGSHGGAFVRESGSDGIRDSIDAMLAVGRLSLHDLMEMRSMLLAQSVHLGTERATVEEFALIEDSIARLEIAVKDDDQYKGIQPATDFYRLVARASHNPLLVLIMDALAALVGQMLIALGEWPRIDAVSPRLAVLKAMREGRAEDAARLIHSHSESSKLVLKSYEEKFI